MTKEEIFTDLKPIIADSLSRQEEEVTLTADFSNDLGADSLDVVQTIQDIEKKFNIVLSDTEVEKVTTVQNVVDIIYSRQTINK